MNRVLFANTPLFVFVSVWGAIFILNAFDLYGLHPVTMHTKAIVAVGIFGVIGGYLLASMVYDKTPIYATENKDVQSQILFHEKPLWLMTVITTSIYFLSGFIAMKVIGDLSGGMGNYLEDPLGIRETVVNIQKGRLSGIPLSYRLAIVGINIGMLSNIFGGALFAQSRKSRALALLPLLVGAFIALVFIRRYSFINGIAFWLFAYMFTSLAFNRKEGSKIALKAILTVFFLLFVFFGFSYLVVLVRSPWADDITEYFFKSIYTYFVGNLSSLDIWLNSPNITIEHSYGQTIFRDFFNYMSKIGLWSFEDVKGVHQEFVKIGHKMWVNTFTFIKAMYEDFNIYGVVSLSFIWGFVARLILVRFFKHPSYLSLLAVSIVSFSFLMSFYSFYFRNTISTIFWIVVVLFIQRVIKHKSVPTTQSLVMPAVEN